jgi:hypothetical protein
VRKLDIARGGAGKGLIVSSSRRRSRSTIPQAPMLHPMVWIPIGILTQGATDHVTSVLEKLSTKAKYMGKEKIQTASGSGMRIDYVGSSTLKSPARDLDLKNVLLVPSTQKSLLSIHRLTTDNPIFIEYHSHYFLDKDRATRKILLQGRCKGGLYPWSSLEQSSSRCVFMITKPSFTGWHDRLGHPSMVVISRVVKDNNLLVPL